MRGRGISRGQIAAVAGFSFSCFVLLLYLWLTSGGAIPMAPAKYRVHVLLPQAKGLGPHSDVRVSGVTVGHVIYVKGAEPVARGLVVGAEDLVGLDGTQRVRSDERSALRHRRRLAGAE